MQDFGFNPISGSGSKHALGEFANIIQHPDGRQKEVVLQDNMIAGRHEKALHYVADTEPGSSGSPVFNNDWQTIALHHWGTAKDETTIDGDYSADAVNEGIRISAIVSDIHERQDAMRIGERDLVLQALEIGSSSSPQEVSRQIGRDSMATAPGWRANDDGSVDLAGSGGDHNRCPRHWRTGPGRAAFGASQENHVNGKSRRSPLLRKHEISRS